MIFFLNHHTYSLYTPQLCLFFFHSLIIQYSFSFTSQSFAFYLPSHNSVHFLFTSPLNSMSFLTSFLSLLPLFSPFFFLSLSLQFYALSFPSYNLVNFLPLQSYTSSFYPHIPISSFFHFCTLSLFRPYNPILLLPNTILYPFSFYPHKPIYFLHPTLRYHISLFTFSQLSLFFCSSI